MGKNTYDPNKKNRTKGFQRPFTTEQISSWCGQIITNILYYGLAISFASRNNRNIHSLDWNLSLIVAHTCIVILSLGLWLFLENHDPAKESIFSTLLPDTTRWTTIKYCRVHKKQITGIDHFCTWLNVTIGKSNYVPFIMLTACGILQFGIQLIWGILALTSERDTVVATMRNTQDSGAVLFQVFVGLQLAVACLLFIAYCTLGGFHMYLGILGISTYGFLLGERQQHRKKMLQSKEAKRKSCESENDDKAEAVVSMHEGL